jgi:hypothetical protein
MTEAEWDRCTDPIPMLDFLRGMDIASERKLRLFAASCCRRAWHRLDADGRAVIEMLERVADGSASEAEVRAAVWASRGCQDLDARAAVDHAAVGAWRPAVTLLAAVCGRPAGVTASPADPSAPDRERRAQAGLLRCVLGPLPFRRVVVDPAWVAWNDGAARKIAQAVYDERRFADLPVLADALEESGCTDAELLGHLRSPGPHVRGCWAVDALLARE